MIKHVYATFPFNQSLPSGKSPSFLRCHQSSLRFQFSHKGSLFSPKVRISEGILSSHRRGRWENIIHRSNSLNSQRHYIDPILSVCVCVCAHTCVCPSNRTHRRPLRPVAIHFQSLFIATEKVLPLIHLILQVLKNRLHYQLNVSEWLSCKIYSLSAIW